MRNAAKVGVCFLLFILADGTKGDDPKPNPSGLAKEVETWLYPGATVVSSADSGGRIFQAVLTTADAKEAVLAHYDKKCGTSLAEGVHPPGIFDNRSDLADGKFTGTLSTDDSTIPATTRKQKSSRGVTLLQVTRDEPGFFVTVLVTRTKEEAITHLLVTYLKK